MLTLKPQNVVIKTALPGRTAPTLIAEVRPQVTGIVQSRTFTEGAEVKAGSVLYRLDPSTYQAAYDSARAAIAKAEASVQTARRNVERNKELVAIKFVSQQAYDDAVTTLRQNEADLAAAKAATEAARINLAYTNVVAPIAGRIGRSTVTPGALVTANQPTALVTIQQMNPMYVDITQSSTEALAAEARDGERGVQAGARGCGTRDAATRGRHELSVSRAPCSSPMSRSMHLLARSRCVRCSRIPTAFCCPTCMSGQCLRKACARTPSSCRSRQ